MAITILPHHPGVPRAVHHTALVPSDLDKSLRFYRDGIGLVQMLDEKFESNYQLLFRAKSNVVRVIYLGDPAMTNGGLLELMKFDGGADPALDTPPALSYGFLMLSFWVDVSAVLTRLDQLGLARDKAILELEGGGIMATVRDPDNVLIELIPNTIALKPF
jgi:catechol 2,3-dioxygenase-like lactoylglutathione lyase family enzyme